MKQYIVRVDGRRGNYNQYGMSFLVGWFQLIGETVPQLEPSGHQAWAYDTYEEAKFMADEVAAYFNHTTVVRVICISE